MKNITTQAVALFASVFMLTTIANAQRRTDKVDYNKNKHDDVYYRNDRNNGYDERNFKGVDRRPAAPGEFRGKRPSPRHQWVSGEWIYIRSGYAYKPGYWTVPQYSGFYENGKWERYNKKWVWVPGHWSYTARGRF